MVAVASPAWISHTAFRVCPSTEAKVTAIELTKVVAEVERGVSALKAPPSEFHWNWLGDEVSSVILI